MLNKIDKSTQGLTNITDLELILDNKIFSLKIENIIKILIGQFLIILSAEDSGVYNTSVSRCQMLFDKLLFTYFVEEYKNKNIQKLQSTLEVREI